MTAARQMLRYAHPLAIGVAALVVSGVLVHAAAGELSGVLSGVVAVCVITPPLVAQTPRLPDSAAAVAAVSLASCAAWSVSSGCLSTQICLCGVVVGAVLTAQVTIISVARRCRATANTASALSTVLGAAWLSWPLWLRHAPPLLVRLHPLLNVNGLLVDQFGVWTEQPLAYRVMVLGQDVPYALPTSPWACIAAHVGLASAVLVVGWTGRGSSRMASRSTNQIEAAAAPANTE